MRFPSEKIQSGIVMRSCEKFAERGIGVELWIPRRLNEKFEYSDLFSWYRVKKNFVIRKLPAIDLVPLVRGGLGFLILTFTFNLSVLFYALARGLLKRALFYTHGPAGVIILAVFRPRLFMEIHELNRRFKRDNFFIKWIFSRVSLFLATNQFKTDFLHKEFGIPYQRLLRQQNAVDVGMFAIDLDCEDVRKKLDLPQDKTIILYAGQLTDWKGVDIFFEASKLLARNEVIYVAGGTDEDIGNYKRKAQSVKCEDKLAIVGRKPHEEVPLWLRAADALVLPHTAKFDIAKFDASPVKLFEYMASGRPVVVSDLPSMREIVDESMVWFFEPDNPQSLADAMHRALLQKKEAGLKINKAREEVGRYSWDRWADNVVAFINNQ